MHRHTACTLYFNPQHTKGEMSSDKDDVKKKQGRIATSLCETNPVKCLGRFDPLYAMNQLQGSVQRHNSILSSNTRIFRDDVKFSAVCVEKAERADAVPERTAAITVGFHIFRQIDRALGS